MQKTIILIASIIQSLLLGIAYPVAAQQAGGFRYEDHSEMPAGITGDRIRAAIGAVNSGDPAVITAFFEKHCAEGFRNFIPLAEHINYFRSIRRETGGVRFHAVRTYDPPRPDQTVVILQDELYSGWRAVIFNFEATNEALIAGLQFNPALFPTNVPQPAPLSEAGLIADVDALLDRLCEQDIFSGAVLIARGDEVLLERACGVASKRFGVANNLDTKFNLGSMNKMFTSVAVARLVEAGELSYNDPVSRYLDESWLPQSITDRIAIHHLLSHTSGLGSYFNDAYWQSSRDRFRQLEDYKPLIRGDTLAFEPGARFRYSNTGMFLLGVIIETVTGEDYFEHIRRHVTGPAGMTNTDCYEMDRPVPNLAIGYMPDPENEYGWQNNLYMHVLKGGPAGGGFSTVRDLHRFVLALQSGKLVNAVSLEKLWTGTDQAGNRYGYGFSVEEGPAGKVVGHGGGFPGLNSNLDIFLDKGYIVAVMSNYDRGAGPVAHYIKELIGQRLETR